MSAMLDRDAARDVLHTRGIQAWRIESWLEALEACVRPAPPQSIDRDDLMGVLRQVWHHEVTGQGGASLILALLRPVEGVVLTPEEAAIAWSALLYKNRNEPRASENDQRAALAARLEAAS